MDDSSTGKSLQRASPYECCFCQEFLRPVPLSVAECFRALALTRTHFCPHCFDLFQRPAGLLRHVPGLVWYFNSRQFNLSLRESIAELFSGFLRLVRFRGARKRQAIRKAASRSTVSRPRTANIPIGSQIVEQGLGSAPVFSCTGSCSEKEGPHDLFQTQVFASRARTPLQSLLLVSMMETAEHSLPPDVRPCFCRMTQRSHRYMAVRGRISVNSRDRVCSIRIPERSNRDRCPIVPQFSAVPAMKSWQQHSHSEFSNGSARTMAETSSRLLVNIANTIP
jgi:hypothetical protein